MNEQVKLLSCLHEYLIDLGKAELTSKMNFPDHVTLEFSHRTAMTSNPPLDIMIGHIYFYTMHVRGVVVRNAGTSKRLVVAKFSFSRMRALLRNNTKLRSAYLLELLNESIGTHTD